MAHFRDQKQHLMQVCSRQDWMRAFTDEITDAERAKASVNALLALLSRPDCRWQAAFALGVCLPYIAEENMESARVFMRRLMWSLNEESGNLGWGIPEAMGSILANSPALAREYGRIFLSYGYQTGKDDNFLDHAPLRRGVYWGIGVLAAASPQIAAPALPHLVAALKDGDPGICGMAAWALGQLAAAMPDADFDRPGIARDWRTAASVLEQELDKRQVQGQEATEVQLFDGERIVSPNLSELLADTLVRVGLRLDV